jgi:hypothetical protein
MVGGSAELVCGYAPPSEPVCSQALVASSAAMPTITRAHE